MVMKRPLRVCIRTSCVTDSLCPVASGQQPPHMNLGAFTGFWLLTENVPCAIDLRTHASLRRALYPAFGSVTCAPLASLCDLEGGTPSSAPL